MDRELIAALRWFASVPEPEARPATAETAAMLQELMRAGLLLRTFSDNEVRYELTAAGRDALA